MPSYWWTYTDRAVMHESVASRVPRSFTSANRLVYPIRMSPRSRSMWLPVPVNGAKISICLYSPAHTYSVAKEYSFNLDRLHILASGFSLSRGVLDGGGLTCGLVLGDGGSCSVDHGIHGFPQIHGHLLSRLRTYVCTLIPHTADANPLYGTEYSVMATGTNALANIKTWGPVYSDDNREITCNISYHRLVEEESISSISCKIPGRQRT